MASPRKKAASAAARLLGQLGGRKGGKASAAALTPEQRRERGRAAIAARWKTKKTMPIDQAAVMARLEGADPVVLRVAPGPGGQRRQVAVHRLADKGLVRILDVGADTLTIARANKP